MKGLMIISHNMEDVESLATRALLIRSGFDITLASFDSVDRVRTAFNLNVEVEANAHTVKASDYDFIIIPGGKYVGETVDKDQNIKRLLKSFDQANKVIAAICAGPRFLGQAGLLDGIHYTAFPGSEKDIPKGYYHPEEKALTDQNFITARGAGVVYEFVYEMIKYFKGKADADALLKQITYW